MKFSHYQLQFKFWPSFLALLMLIILILLGVWQMKRYHFKLALVTQYQQAIHQTPVDLSQLGMHQDIQFQPVKVTGHYLNDRTMLLGNRFYQDKLGFEILTPFQPDHTETILLVNRGWIPANLPSQKLPLIKPIIGTQQLTGYIQVLGRQGFILGKSILTPNQWPLLLQKIDFRELTQLTGLHFYPFILRLNAQQPTTIPPERHLGYAIQWFALAIALIIAFIFFCRKKRENSLEQ